MDALANEWEAEDLDEWGLDVWQSEPTAGGKEKDLSGKVRDAFEVIIECENEREQEQIFNKLFKEGYKCRVLTL